MALPPSSSSTFHEDSKEFYGCEDAKEAASWFRPSLSVKPDSIHLLPSDGRGGAGGSQLSGAASSLPLTNGFDGGDRSSSVEGSPSPEGEAGFADFGVFGEQAAHPWCCGLTERWDSQVGGANQQVGNSGRSSVTASAPRSQHALGAKEDVCSPDAVWQLQDRSHPQGDGEAQETSATSCRSQSSTEEAHLTDRNSEQRILGSIPLSDSFADFCSAPTQGGGGGGWVLFEEQFSLTEQMEVSEAVSSIQPEEEEPGAARKSSTQTACRVLQLLQSSFPEVQLQVEEEEELLDLGAVLQAQLPPQSDEAADPSHTQRNERMMLWPHRHIHSSVGLQFRWDGSHSHEILLRCLGVDSRNIFHPAKVFTKKQPQTLSAHASGLGTPDPSKDTPAVCSPDPMKACSGQDPVDCSVQELPSSPLDWSVRGLSSSQDSASPRRAPLFWGWK